MFFLWYGVDANLTKPSVSNNPFQNSHFISTFCAPPQKKNYYQLSLIKIYIFNSYFQLMLIQTHSTCNYLQPSLFHAFFRSIVLIFAQQKSADPLPSVHLFVCLSVVCQISFIFLIIFPEVLILLWINKY